MNYLNKMTGRTKSPPAVDAAEIAWSWIGAFLGITPLAYLNYHLVGPRDLVYIIGSFGASAVLVYGAVRSPLAQPRNLIGGHMISALVGVVIYQLLGDIQWLACAIAVASAIAAMHATKTLHPPGGATALIAVIGSGKIHQLGYLYILVPVGLGAAIMLLIAVLVNNLSSSRRYPEYWI